jgi:hypothetical protein
MLSSTCLTGTKSKSVSFPDSQNELAQVVLEVESCCDFSAEDKNNLWFSRSDYHFSRSTARVIAKESERYGHSKYLDDTYSTTFKQDVQDRINIWALHGHSQRGLERWANTSHGRSRKDDQYMYINGVIRAQQEMKMKECYDGERLREVGHILSRKSRLFAQLLGEADAHAMKRELGMIDRRVSPRARPKNLGLVGNGKVNRVSDLTPPAHSIRRPSRRVSDTAQAPKITIRPRPGRVPRVA